MPTFARALRVRKGDGVYTMVTSPLRAFLVSAAVSPCSRAFPAVGTPSLLWVLSSRAWQDKVFSSGWLSLRSCLGAAELFLVASERCRGERAGFQGAQSPWASGGWCFFGAFPLLSSGRGFLYSHGQTAIRKRQGKSLRLHYDVFGSRRGTSTLNLQSGLFWCSATVARVRRSKAFLKS